MTVSATDLGSLVDALRREPDGAVRLAALLPETHPVHAHRSAAETNRSRGYILAAFVDTGLPDTALPYVIESLESSGIPYEIAGAAMSLRGLGEISADTMTRLDVALARAVRALAGADATVSFESYRPAWPYPRPTSALTEVVRAVGLLGARAPQARAELVQLLRERDRLSPRVLAEIDGVLGEPAPSAAHACCHGPVPSGTVSAERPDHPEPLVTELEDQDGHRVTFAGFFSGKPAVLAFFYTRCDNPYKCSRTVTALATLQGLIADRGLEGAVKITAITYDPEFDLPVRLRAYGRDRGVRFGPDTRFFRAVVGFPQLRRQLALGVSYGASTVGRHRIEVYVLDARGRVVTSLTRLQWQPEQVLAIVEDLVRAP